MARFLYIGNLDDETTNQAPIIPPTSHGYWTDITVWIIHNDAPDDEESFDPEWFYMGMNEPSDDSFPIATGSTATGPKAENGFLFGIQNFGVVDLDGEQAFIYRYYYSGKIYNNGNEACLIKHVMPNPSGDVTIVVEGDYVPKIGSTYRYVHNAEDSTGDEVTNMMLFDLSHAVVKVDYYIESSSAYLGKLVCQLYRGHEFKTTYDDEKIGSIRASAEDRLTNHRAHDASLVGEQPIQTVSSNGAGTGIFEVKDVEAGDAFAVYLVNKVGTPTSVEMTIHVAGLVAISRGEEKTHATFDQGSHIIDVNELELTIDG